MHIVQFVDITDGRATVVKPCKMNEYMQFIDFTDDSAIVVKQCIVYSL